jgi:hypothetical protein
VREPDEPVRQWLAGLAACQLLFADRFPVVVDHLCWLAGDLLDRQLEVLGPEAKPGLSSEGAVVGARLAVSPDRFQPELRGSPRHRD